MQALPIVDPSILTSAVFSIEGDPTAPQYRGLHNDRARWNGWAQPLFTRSEVERLAAQIAADGNTWTDPQGVEHTYNTLTFDGDVLVYTTDDDGHPWTERLVPYVLDGVFLYDCGLGWVWDTVDCQPV